VFTIIESIIAMTICLFYCEKSVDVFLFGAIYSAVVFLFIFIANKIAGTKSRYVSKEFYYLSGYVLPFLIILRYVFNIRLRLGLLAVVLIFAVSGLVRLGLLCKNRNNKGGKESTS
jgi:hypothetical protein